jgi:hypothetical protein
MLLINFHSRLLPKQPLLLTDVLPKHGLVFRHADERLLKLQARIIAGTGFVGKKTGPYKDPAELWDGEL